MCGVPVTVHSGREGTSSYQPEGVWLSRDDADAIEKTLRAAIDYLRGDPAVTDDPEGWRTLLRAAREQL
jgi:hypothetical protein